MTHSPVLATSERLKAGVPPPPTTNTHKWIGAIAVISMPVAFISLYLAMAAVSFDLEAVGDPLHSIAIGADKANFVHWSMIFDMFGFYLLLIPATIYLYFQMRDDSPVAAAIISFGGLFYMMLGASGSSILSVTWPDLIREYAAAAETERAIALGLFQLITNAVTHGLWYTLEFIAAALWWCGIGVLFLPRDRIFAVCSIVLGLCCLLGAIGTIFVMPGVAATGLDLYLVLGPLWAFWLGLRILRQSDVAGRYEVSK